jgi:hypothetical protein
MKKKAQMTYMGPCGILDDPTSGFRWARGETIEVDMDVAQRLLLDPSAEWDTDAPRPEPAPEPERGWPYVQMPVPGSEASETIPAPGTGASGVPGSEGTAVESAVESMAAEPVPDEGET